MSVTISQIKSDIASGKSKVIYLSEKFLWWTHLKGDLEEATEKGIEYRRQKHFEKNTGLPFVCWPENNTDPLGGNVVTNNEPALFITKTLLNPKHYGKHRIQAFLKAHHQNCNNFYSNKWDGYNKLIDREKDAQKK